MIKLLIHMLMLLMLTSCAYSNEKEAVGMDASIICKEPRSQLCTREYNPVCSTLADGSSRTDSTGCTACADSKVVSYIMGECK